MATSNPYIGLSLEILSSRLVAYQSRLPALLMGEAVSSLASEEERISFFEPNISDIEKHIKWIREAMDLAMGNSKKIKGVNIIGIKGIRF